MKPQDHEPTQDTDLPSPQSKETMNDRLIDLMLEEELGDECPPDLELKILGRLDSQCQTDRVKEALNDPRLFQQETSSRYRLAFIAAAVSTAAMITLLLSMALVWISSINQAREQPGTPIVQPNLETVPTPPDRKPEESAPPSQEEIIVLHEEIEIGPDQVELFEAPAAPALPELDVLKIHDSPKLPGFKIKAPTYLES